MMLGVVPMSVVVPPSSDAYDRGIDVGRARQADNRWQEDGDRPRIAHEAGEHAPRQHHHDGQPDLTSSGNGQDALAGNRHQAGLLQTAPHNEQRGDDQYDRVREASQGLRRGQDARDHQQHNNTERHNIHAQPLGDEEDDRPDQDSQRHPHFQGHQLPDSFSTCSRFAAQPSAPPSSAQSWHTRPRLSRVHPAHLAVQAVTS